MESPSQKPRSRRRDMALGLVILFCAFVACLLLSLWGMHASTPRLAPQPESPTQIGLEGFPEEVDPFDLLDVAMDVTVRDRFQGFVAQGVRSNGTIDLTQTGTSIRYSFQSPSGLGPQPPRKGGTLPTRRYCGQQSVIVDSNGLFAEPDNPERPCPSTPPEALAPPERCSLKQIWALAKKRNIVAKGSAEVEYFHAQTGPAFRLKSAARSLIVSAKDCKTVLVGREARGLVP